MKPRVIRRGQSILLLSTLLFSMPIRAAHTPHTPYYDQHASGWHWYQDPLETPFTEVVASPPVTQDPVARLHTLQKNLEIALDTAILSPTVPHLLRYIQLQNQVSQRSARFAALWEQVLLQHPELNFSITHPTEALALQAAQEKESAQQEHRLREFAEHSGLVFFYKASCPYCARFAPIVQRLSQRYGISVLAVTLDGRKLSVFPESMLDVGQARSLGIRTVPALLAVNLRNRRMTRVATGLVSESSLRSRLLAAERQLP